jgi:hypothetical protein
MLMRRMLKPLLLVVALISAVPVLLAQSNEGQFALAVIPDTQYLFDQDRGDADVLTATLQWIIDNTDSRSIAFTAHLGDIVENALPEEFEQVDAVYDLFDENDIQYSVAAGNHDLTSSRQYDSERDPAAEPYLQYFSPERVADNPTFGGATANGYNTYFIFQGGGQDWLLLALDWQVSRDTIDWAQSVIDANPTLPVILTTHHLIDSDSASNAVMTDYGQYLWDNLINDNDQIFLTLNGHYWPSARTVMQNAAGHDVYLHLANYQDQYYGGVGMMRLYDFDLLNNVIKVSTFSPWVMGKSADERSAFEKAELYDAVNFFAVEIDFAERFAGFQGGAVEQESAPVAAEDVVIDGTVAYWRFEGTPGEPITAIADLSGNGNDLTREILANGAEDDLVWTDQYAPDQPSRGSAFFNGSYRDPSFGGAYLHTADDAPLNSLTFEDGYTIEAFVRLPENCCTARHAWMGILSRLGTGGDIGQTEGDADEPVTQLAVAPGGVFQWAIRTTNAQDILTNWSHEIDEQTWYHIALVNDGAQTVMYLDGVEILRNPRAESVGLATNNDLWTVGAGHYANLVEHSFFGWLGDVRIVDRALTADEFMTAR